MELQDCIIVGGGPAGLNAAVVLGRCRRKVMVFDTEQYRNRWSHGVHNYLTRDDIDPADFIKLCRKELKKYDVQLLHQKVIKARKKDEIFTVTDSNNNTYYCKKLLIATGVKDFIPEVPGMEEMYGKSIFIAPIVMPGK
jgi:thioredoxin reductase